jgi:hypothetical protein
MITEFDKNRTLIREVRSKGYKKINEFYKKLTS